VVDRILQREDVVKSRNRLRFSGRELRKETQVLLFLFEKKRRRRKGRGAARAAASDQAVGEMIVRFALQILRPRPVRRAGEGRGGGEGKEDVPTDIGGKWKGECDHQSQKLISTRGVEPVCRTQEERWRGKGGVQKRRGSLKKGKKRSGFNCVR